MTSAGAGGPKYIGQRLNVCYPDVREAVARREGEMIAALARRQAAAGACALDLCCAGRPDEAGALAWMAETVQRAVDVPLCLDSAAADVLTAAARICIRPPIINAVSIDHVRAGAAPDIGRLPALMWIVSAFDPAGAAQSPEARLKTASAVADALSGVPQARMILDPLFLPSGAYPHAWEDTCAAAALLRRRFPEAGTLCAAGNVSFGARGRAKVDRRTIHRAIGNGFDWLLCDVTSIL